MTVDTQEPEADRRYRVLVLLNRTDRPTNFKFICPRCGYKVAELMNAEVRALSDTQNIDNLDLQTVSVRCDGIHADGRCRIHYSFSLGKTL